jgi:hypothetical protein
MLFPRNSNSITSCSDSSTLTPRREHNITLYLEESSYFKNKYLYDRFYFDYSSSQSAGSTLSKHGSATLLVTVVVSL